MSEPMSTMDLLAWRACALMASHVEGVINSVRGPVEDGRVDAEQETEGLESNGSLVTARIEKCTRYFVQVCLRK
ncbi:hypothetical protein B0T18DRAFT_363459, partial [Schizothecium vesticola]